jgi:hypothetical protein
MFQNIYSRAKIKLGVEKKHRGGKRKIQIRKAS